MSLMPSFVLKVARAAGGTEPELGKMLIIVRKRYAHLEKELAQTFAKQKGVTIVVDRRNSERRKLKRKLFTPERRRGDRRKSNEELLNVILPT